MRACATPTNTPPPSFYRNCPHIIDSRSIPKHHLKPLFITRHCSPTPTPYLSSNWKVTPSKAPTLGYKRSQRYSLISHVHVACIYHSSMDLHIQGENWLSLFCPLSLSPCRSLSLCFVICGTGSPYRCGFNARPWISSDDWKDTDDGMYNSQSLAILRTLAKQG